MEYTFASEVAPSCSEAYSGSTVSRDASASASVAGGRSSRQLRLEQKACVEGCVAEVMANPDLDALFAGLREDDPANVQKLLALLHERGVHVRYSAVRALVKRMKRGQQKASRDASRDAEKTALLQGMADEAVDALFGGYDFDEAVSHVLWPKEQVFFKYAHRTYSCTARSLR